METGKDQSDIEELRIRILRSKLKLAIRARARREQQRLLAIPRPVFPSAIEEASRKRQRMSYQFMTTETKTENGCEQPASQIMTEVKVDYREASKELSERLHTCSAELLNLANHLERASGVDPEEDLDTIGDVCRHLEHAIFLYGGDCRWCEIRDGLVNIEDGF